MKKRRGSAWGRLLLLAVVLGAAWGVWRSLQPGGLLRGEETVRLEGVPVRRGPLTISVTERGNLEAADSLELRNETDYRTTILSIVDEGIRVEEGDLLCELDVASLTDDLFQREISVRNAEAAFVKSQQNYEIQKSQNESDIATAEQDLEFARQDLEKFIEADRPLTLAQAREDIVLATEEWERAKDDLDWSEKLAAKGFLTQTELEADRLALTRSEIGLEQARRRLGTQEDYELPKQEAVLRAALAEAERELVRVKLQATARIADFKADLSTNEAKLTLERDKLAKMERQIEAGLLYAPRAGMVVYVKEDGGRWGRDDPIEKGTEVSPNQGIISIPTPGGMVAKASLHESVLKQVEVGQPVALNVDALPQADFSGRVKSVAVLPDQNSWFANPNMRLYRTDIEIFDASEDLRPGMSCSIEILVDEIEDATYVPVQAIFRDAGTSICFVAENGGHEARAVEVGAYNDRWVQVLEGLTEGEIVSMSAPPGFEPKPGEAPSEGPAAEGPERGASGPAAGGAPTASAGRPGGGRPQGGGGRPEGAGGGEKREVGGRPSGAPGGERPAGAAKSADVGGSEGGEGRPDSSQSSADATPTLPGAGETAAETAGGAPASATDAVDDAAAPADEATSTSQGS